MDHPINRRQFVTGALGVVAASTLPHPWIRLTPRAVPSATSIPSLPGSTPIVVLCTLYGGNDGLNTVVPMSDPTYFSKRGTSLQPQQVLSVGSGFGLNPALVGMKSMWDANSLAIVRGVGYDNPSLSHFQSMDIWQSGSLSNDVGSGWLGRWLDRQKPDPFHALSVGTSVLPAMIGAKRKAAAIVDSTSAGSQLPSGDPAFIAVYRELQRALPVQTKLEGAVSHSGTNMLNVSRAAYDALAAHAPPSYPKGSDAGDIGNQLGVVSQLIRANIPTVVYAVTQGGYDTHSGEVSTQGQNLKELDTAITGFFSSLAGSPHAANTILVIYSEFGRRVESNASGGADHGTASNVFVLGGPVKGGLYGEAPSLTAVDPNGNLVHTVDYRSVFATVLEKAMSFESKPIFHSNFPLLGFL